MEEPVRRETPDLETTAERLLLHAVPRLEEASSDQQQRLREIAMELVARGMPDAFVITSLRSTLEVIQDIQAEEARPDNAFQREHVRQFIEENAVPEGDRQPRFNLRRERKREERERLHANACRLLREARQSRARHEVKKTRNMLLKLDQRELRRILGREGDELCRQINTWLRSTADMF